MSLLLGPALGGHVQAQGEEQQYLNEVLALTTRKNAAYYRVNEGQVGELYKGRTFTMEGRLKAEGTYKDAALTIEHGTFTFYHANGKVESQGDYAMGQKSGLWKRYDQWGRPLAEKVYDPNALANIIYTQAQTMPSYPEGEKALVRVIRERVVPQDGRSPKKQVVASVLVEKTGELSDVHVIEGGEEGFDQQVVDAIRSTAPWTPGMEKGAPVRVRMKVPVQF